MVPFNDDNAKYIASNKIDDTVDQKKKKKEKRHSWSKQIKYERRVKV